MKKFFGFFREIMLAFALPILLVFVLVLAFETSNPLMGLAIILASFIFQDVATSGWLRSNTGCNHSDRFSWKYFKEFSEYDRPYLSGYGLVVLSANIMYNLLKVATVICTIIFISSRFKVEINEFNPIILIIAVFVSIVAMLGMSKRRLYDYQTVKAFLGFIVLVSLIFLTAITYGSQLIWVPFILVVVVIRYNGFAQLKDLLGIKWNTAPIIFSIFLLAAIVSTITQYSVQIGNFFSEIFTWIGNIPNQIIEFILSPSAYPWLIGFIILFVLAVVIFLGRIIIVEIRVKKENKLLAQAKEKKALEEKEKKDAISKRFADLLMYGCGPYPETNWVLDDVLFVIDNYKSKFISQNQATADLIAWSLTRVDLARCLIASVSEKKNQIIFRPETKEIIDFFNEYYAKSHDDKTLKGLENSIESFSRYLNQKTLKSYKGVEELKNIIAKRCSSFPINFLNKLSKVK